MAPVRQRLVDQQPPATDTGKRPEAPGTRSNNTGARPGIKIGQATGRTEPVYRRTALINSAWWSTAHCLARLVLAATPAQYSRNPGCPARAASVTIR